MISWISDVRTVCGGRMGGGGPGLKTRVGTGGATKRTNISETKAQSMI